MRQAEKYEDLVHTLGQHKRAVKAEEGAEAQTSGRGRLSEAADQAGQEAHAEKGRSMTSPQHRKRLNAQHSMRYGWIPSKFLKSANDLKRRVQWPPCFSRVGNGAIFGGSAQNAGNECDACYT